MRANTPTISAFAGAFAGCLASLVLIAAPGDSQYRTPSRGDDTEPGSAVCEPCYVATGCSFETVYEEHPGEWVTLQARFGPDGGTLVISVLPASGASGITKTIDVKPNERLNGYSISWLLGFPEGGTVSVEMTGVIWSNAERMFGDLISPSRYAPVPVWRKP